MSARSRANKRSKRAAHAIAQQHSEPGWSAIRAAREIVAARDDATRWLVDKEKWRRGYGDVLIRAWQEMDRTRPDDAQIPSWVQFGLQRAHFHQRPGGGQYDLTTAAESLLDHVHGLHGDLFTLAEPFVVSLEMHRVVQAAAETVDVTDLATLTRDDLAVEHGLIWLPEPQSIRDSEMLAHALSWTYRELLGLPCLVATAWEHRPGAHDTPALVESWSTIMVLVGERHDDADHFTRVGSIDVAAYLFAFLRLAAQRIVITPRLRDQERLPGDPRPHELVRVIRLRAFRPAATVDAEHQPVDWQHRWVVKMHKVKQWYPTEGVHRVIFRGPFFKGPDDKPLLTGEKVNALVR